MSHYKYSLWAKMYTVWLILITLALFLVLDKIWFDSTRPEGYVLILLVLISQYFITERHAKYWPVSIVDDGLLFHEGNIEHHIAWTSMKSIKSFPTANFQPRQWSQAMLSAGSLIHTETGEEFVIYKKLKGYEAVLDACHKNT